MSFATQSTPTAITQATTFLTQPLIAVHPTSTVSSLRLVLHSSLTSSFMSSPSATLTLSLSPTAPPPRPIHAACVAANFPWSDWITILGGSTFDLHIVPSRVSVHMPDGRIAQVWEDPSSSTSTLQPPNTPSVTALQSSLKRRTRPPPTLAQQLLESTHEDKEADEMFAMLSKCDISIVSPTPTRGTFSPLPLKAAFDIPLLSIARPADSVHVISFHDALSEPDLDSRPSSRSSNTSGVSLSSFASSYASSVSSAPSIRSSPSPSPSRKNKEGPRVIVDTTKTTPTRYTYSGGVSTVLTGGVMLGSGRPSTPRKVASGALEKPRAKQGKGRASDSTSIWKPRAKMTPGVGVHVDTNDWRCGTASQA